MNWKASFLGSFTHLLHRSLGWFLLAGSLFLLVQCGGSGSEGTVPSPSPPLPSPPVGTDDCKTEAEGATGLTIVGSKLSSKRASIGDNLRVTVTIRNKGTATSGGTGSPQTVTFYRSSNKFISPRDEVLGTASFGTLRPNAESNPSFSFLAQKGDNYYGACLGTTNNCQIGVKVSVTSHDISGSDSYTDPCTLYKVDRTPITTSASINAKSLTLGRTVDIVTSVEQNQARYYLLQVEQEGLLDIWSTGSQDTVALLFDGNCKAISEHYYAEDGGIGGSNNFQIKATAEAGYYFLVVHEKSLKAANFMINIRLNGFPGTGEDPLYSDQWHLNNPNDQEIDINAPQAWEITRGCPSVLVAVIDTRANVAHPDLAPNYDDRYDNFNPPLMHEHGTLVSGVIAAAGNNGIGVSGVAPEVGFVSRFAIGASGSVNWSISDALIGDKVQVAISNNSYGLGYIVQGDFELNKAIHQTVLEEGITSGYGGKGIFYVFAAGNDHVYGDNSNYHSPERYYSVATICAVGKNGTRSSYSEKGANLWICAPSSASVTNVQAGIVTTDIVGSEGSSTGDYADDFRGTSAAAPIVSGVAALMRSINPELGWRDVRLILAVTAQKNDSTNPGWFEGMASYDGSNYLGSLYQHNHEYGFGVVDAQAAVSQSQSWNNVGQLVVSSSQSKDIPTAKQQVPDGNTTGLSSVITVAGLNDTLDFIEYIDIDINMDGKHYGNLQINLISPDNKTSTLAEEHHCVYNRILITCAFNTPTKASFGSARHLGESPDGDWTLEIVDDVINHNNNVYSWGLKFYGHKKP